MFKLIIYILVIFSIKISFAQDNNTLYEKSSQFYNDEKYEKALSVINQAIAKSPKESKLYVLKAEISYAINKDADEFFSLLAKAVEVEPNSPIPLLDRAYYYEQISDYSNAILDYNDALRLTDVDSIRLMVYINRGGSYVKIRKLQQGYEDLLKGFAIDSNNIGVLNNLAMCLDDLNRRDEATRYLLKIIELDPTSFYAHMNLGFQASLNHEYKEALVYLNKADELEPNQPFTLNNRGYVKLKLDDIAGALVDINKSIELDPNNSYAYRNKALVYIEKKDNNKACENLFLAKKLGFLIYFGEEVDELIKEHCNN